MPHNWIHKLNANNGKLYKLDIIKQALESANLGARDADEFLTLAWYAYNPFTVFNIKQVPTTTGITTNTATVSNFLTMIHALQARTFTGHAAIAELERASLNYDSDLWNNLLRPVILKDLRVGATISSFNKVLKGSKYEIPVFECQLATDSLKHPNKLIGKKIIEPKLDGIRCLAVLDISFPDKARVSLHSRNGKPLANFPHIEAQLIQCVKLYTASPWNENRITKFVFDGEIVSENFQALMKQAQRKSDIDTSNAVFSIFDVVPLDAFNRGRWNMSQGQRTNKWLGAIRDRVNATCTGLHIIKGIEVDLNTSEGHDIMRRFSSAQLDMGYEGIMIKDIDAPYLCKRTTAWLKLKPSITVDLEVVDLEEGTGRNEGRLGALVCEGIDDGRLIKVNVGTGFSDDDRIDLWNRRAQIKGLINEVKADVVTQNQDGTYSLRFPRHVRFRGFEPGEKL
jgi:DNA ligase-1